MESGAGSHAGSAENSAGLPDQGQRAPFYRGGRADRGTGGGKTVRFSCPRSAGEAENAALAAQSNSNTRVIAYLKSRGIDGGLIEQCIRSGQLYESLPYHNAVFVGMDRNGTPRYACLRGIGTDFKGEATGSDKRFSFALPATGESRMLCVFESAIDLLSYATMAQAGGLSWRSQHLLSLAGVYKPQKETQEHRLPLALTQYLKDHAEIKTICLCLDNDMTGRSATEAIRQQLAERYKVASAFPRQGKDYNDWLCIRMGLQPAKENPMTERSFAR